MEVSKTRNVVTKITDWLLVILFLTMIVTPIANSQFGLRLDRKFTNTEKRTLLSLPEFQFDSIAHFPKKYEKYYNDNFSFRNFFIKLNSDFSAATYGESAIPDVLLGSEGWFYYVAKSQGNSLEDYMGRIRVDRATLESVQGKLEQRARELKSKDIRFLVVVAPDKQTIYPEFLPENAKRPRRYPTRFDQINEHLQQNSSVQLLDVRNKLLDEKRRNSLPLYKMTDTHWNHLGGFVAYQEILKSLGMAPKNESDFEWTRATEGMGDLATMLAADEKTQEKNAIIFLPRFENNVALQAVEKSYDSLKVKSVIASHPDLKLPKLLVFHDSFGPAMFPFISLHFRESIFINSNDVTSLEISKIIDRESPDVVLFEVVERYAPSLQWW